MPRPPKWSGPTRAIRVPEALADHLLAIAKELDNPAPADNVQDPTDQPLYKPAADAETIAQGLADGWIVPKAPPQVTFPARESEIEWGDRITGKDPKGKTHSGVVHRLGIKYLKLIDGTGIHMASAVIVTRREDVQVRPCPFAVGDLLSWKGATWKTENVEMTDLLTWKIALNEPDSRPGEWSVESLEWPCDEDCPATAKTPICKPKAAAQTIAQGLAEGWITPSVFPVPRLLTSEGAGGTYRLFLRPQQLPPDVDERIEEYCDRFFEGMGQSDREFLLARLVEEIGEKVDA